MVQERLQQQKEEAASNPEYGSTFKGQLTKDEKKARRKQILANIGVATFLSQQTPHAGPDSLAWYLSFNAAKRYAQQQERPRNVYTILARAASHLASAAGAKRGRGLFLTLMPNASSPNPQCLLVCCDLAAVLAADLALMWRSHMALMWR